MTDQEAFEAFYSPFSEGGAWNRRDPWGKEYDDWGVQMAWRAWQASRKQALEEIQPVLDRIKEHAEFNDPEADTKGGQLLMILGELECIRSLTPTGEKA